MTKKNGRYLVVACILSTSLLTGCISLTGEQDPSQKSFAQEIIQPERLKKEIEQATASANLALQAGQYIDAETLFRKARLGRLG